MSDKNVSLDEMMDTTPRTGSTIPVDLTRGKVTIDANDTVQPEEKKLKATPIQSGPVDMSRMETLDATDILPKRKAVPSMEDNLFADLDAAVDRECESISARIDAVVEAQQTEIEDQAAEKADAEALNATKPAIVDEEDDDLGLYDDDDDDTDVRVDAPRVSAFTVDTKVATAEVEVEEDVVEEVVPVTTTKTEEPKVKVADIAEEPKEPVKARITTTEKVSILDGVNDEDLFADDEELAEPEDTSRKSSDEVLNELKKEIHEKITPVKNTKLDLTKFTFSKKSINAQKAMKLAAKSRESVADWVMLSEGRPISMTGLSGPEILKLNPENAGRNRLNTFKDMYRVLYDHVFDANKPEFETWLKKTRFVDLQHVYFAIYMATFNGSNFVNYQCPHCSKIFLKDIKFENMVVYEDDATREKVRAIMRMDSTTTDPENYEADLYQISNSYAFALRTPSIWNVIIETASLSDKFLEKHADLIDLVSYIEGIYIIDAENNTLIPIDTKPDPNDQAKTSARRIKAFYDVIDQLSSEEYYALRSIIGSYDDNASKMSYQIPACNCPECATEIPANTDMSPDNMLFTRHQLAAIGSM